MSAIAEILPEIDFSYDKNGQVLCRNPKGLIFFLQAEPPAAQKAEARAEARPAAPAPAPTWQPIESVMEVEVRRATEPMPIAEATRRAEPAKTGPLPEAPEAGKPAEKGWFGKLFAK